MEIEKIRNMSDDELKNEEVKAAEQLFRIVREEPREAGGYWQDNTLRLDIAR